MIQRNQLRTANSKRALAYIRISSQRQVNGESPETQLQAINNFADNNNIDIVKTFYDEAKSGKNTDRPALKELIQYAEKHKDDIDHVIVYKMNRASRDMTSYITGFLLPLKRPWKQAKWTQMIMMFASNMLMFYFLLNVMNRPWSR